MPSPITSLHKWILAAPFGVAPAKAQDLWKILEDKGVTFEYVDELGFVFDSSSTADEGIIRASVPALELIWCASYCYWEMHQLICAVQRTGTLAWSWDQQQRRKQIEELYQWALVNVTTQRGEPWPAALPSPTAMFVPNSKIHVSTELFLVAVGWILHHEVGHIIHGHAWKEEQKKRPKRDRELEADKETNRWFFDGVTDAAIRQKVSLGMVTALCTLAARRSPGEDAPLPGETPHPLERLSGALVWSGSRDDDAAYAYAITAIQMNMVLTNFTYVPLSAHDSFRAQLEDLCGVVRSHLSTDKWVVVWSSDLEAYWVYGLSPLAHAETAARAYSLWEKRGRVLWSAEVDWYEAERILREDRLDPRKAGLAVTG